mmetsp:Transcript_63744/g.201614  ORF Transcript_63744/g.201614 Transcript_63744/m.201614 type:complete len:480 (-) Transcript_63744:120-1559(-)
MRERHDPKQPSRGRGRVASRVPRRPGCCRLARRPHRGGALPRGGGGGRRRLLEAHLEPRPRQRGLVPLGPRDRARRPGCGPRPRRDPHPALLPRQARQEELRRDRAPLGEEAQRAGPRGYPRECAGAGGRRDGQGPRRHRLWSGPGQCPGGRADRPPLRGRGPERCDAPRNTRGPPPGGPALRAELHRRRGGHAHVRGARQLPPQKRGPHRVGGGGRHGLGVGVLLRGGQVASTGRVAQGARGHAGSAHGGGLQAMRDRALCRHGRDRMRVPPPRDGPRVGVGGLRGPGHEPVGARRGHPRGRWDPRGRHQRRVPSRRRLPPPPHRDRHGVAHHALAARGVDMVPQGRGLRGLPVLHRGACPPGADRRLPGGHHAHPVLLLRHLLPPPERPGGRELRLHVAHLQGGAGPPGHVVLRRDPWAGERGASRHRLRPREQGEAGLPQNLRGQGQEGLNDRFGRCSNSSSGIREQGSMSIPGVK